MLYAVLAAEALEKKYKFLAGEYSTQELLAKESEHQKPPLK